MSPVYAFGYRHFRCCSEFPHSEYPFKCLGLELTQKRSIPMRTYALRLVIAALLILCTAPAFGDGTPVPWCPPGVVCHK
jgi:hypothetical protein